MEMADLSTAKVGMLLVHRNWKGLSMGSEEEIKVERASFWADENAMIVKSECC